MAKAFKTNKSTVDVYTTDEVYTKNEVYTKDEANSNIDTKILNSQAPIIFYDRWGGNARQLADNTRQIYIYKNISNINSVYNFETIDDVNLPNKKATLLGMLNGDLINLTDTAVKANNHWRVTFSNLATLSPGSIMTWQFIDLFIQDV